MIKQLSSYLLFALIALGLSSCSGTPADVTDDMIEHLKKNGNILATLAGGGSQEDVITCGDSLDNPSSTLAFHRS
ncbi:MAG: hypothetical protein QNL68_06800 [Akkermansiaceae bacterium]|jgi:hypothetical protein